IMLVLMVAGIPVGGFTNKFIVSFCLFRWHQATLNKRGFHPVTESLLSKHNSRFRCSASRRLS
ncbi:MAG: hypothetical protein ACKO24_06835, partial [Leptolyngbyaceae cyanobacterium]